MTNITDEGIEECTGCQLCSAVCPIEAIKIIINNEGFYVPVVDENKCISCSLCKKICYKYDENVNMTNNDENISIYAAKSKDKNILKTSTSGGIATHLVEECIKQGYKVIGVAYDNELDIAINRICTSEKEVEAFKGSKYMQSYTENAFKELLKDKTNQKYVVFGTPCQIYAVKKYSILTNQENRFLLVDIFCHGCPSLNLWKKYIEYIKKTIGTSKFKKVEFRSKVYGWHEFCHYFIGDNGKHKSKKVNDSFFTLFFDNNVLCKACYGCKSRSTLDYTDIRLGDFWGPEYVLDIEGVSAVAICSERGKDLFEKVKNNITLKEHAFEEVKKFQSYGLKYYCNEEVRKRSLDILKTNDNMDVIFKKYKKSYPIRKKIKLYSKQVVYLLPRSIRNKIKRSFYKSNSK